MRVETVKIDKQNKKMIQGDSVRVYWEDLSLNLIIQVSNGTTLLNAYLTARDLACALKKKGSFIWKEETGQSCHPKQSIPNERRKNYE